MKQQDELDLESTHLVLKNKQSGKIASRKDRSAMALRLAARHLTEAGKGGGIVSLLLSKTEQEFAKLAAVACKNELSQVTPRRGKPHRLTERQAVRMAINNDALIVQLAEAYFADIGAQSGPHATSAKAFISWIKKQLADPESRGYKVVLKLAPVLLEVERGDRWWADAIAGRRKTQS